MLDGRQVIILERYFAGDYATALDLLEDGMTPNSWEQAIAAFLRAMCTTTTQRPGEATVAPLVDCFLNLDPLPGHIVFRVRLGLCVATLAADSSASDIAARIIQDALTYADAYAARDVLSDQLCCSNMSEKDRNTLAAVVEGSGLDRDTIPTALFDKLMTAVRTSEAQLTVL